MPRVLPFPRYHRRRSGLGAIDQNSLTQSYGHEWLYLRPDVFSQVLAHGFPGDVYGGSAGIKQDFPPGGVELIAPVKSNGEPGDPLQYPNGEPRLAVPGSDPQVELIYDPAIFHWTYSANDNLWRPSYQPAYAAIYAGLGDKLQVVQNPFNQSWLSIGAQGGYRDPRLIDWSDKYGLITDRSNYLEQQDSFWEQYGPLIAFAGTVAAIIAPAISAGAGEAAEAATTTASTVAPQAALTEAQVAGEEALREISLAQIGGVTITPGEASGWVSALQNAGLSVPSDIASIASGATQSAPTTANGYQSTPSPPSGTSYTPPSENPVSVPSSSPPEPSLTSKIGSQVLTQATKTGAGLLVSSAVKSASSSNTPKNTGPAYNYVTTGGETDTGVTVGDQSRVTSQMVSTSTSAKPFPWLWLIVAAGAILVINRKGKHHE